MSFYRQRFQFIFLHIFLGGLVLLGASACGNEKPSTDTEQGVDSLTQNNALEKDISIIAGESAGGIQIGQEMEASGIFDRFGPADSSDAAMCKSWSMWFPSEDQEVDIFASCDPAMDMKKSIQVIRFSGMSFMSDQKLTESSTGEQVKQRYPAALEEQLQDRSSVPLTLYDDVESGIAFEVVDDKVRAVIVHSPGKKLRDTYSPFYKFDEEWASRLDEVP